MPWDHHCLELNMVRYLSGKTHGWDSRGSWTSDGFLGQHREILPLPVTCNSRHKIHVHQWRPTQDWTEMMYLSYYSCHCHTPWCEPPPFHYGLTMNIWSASHHTDKCLKLQSAQAYFLLKVVRRSSRSHIRVIIGKIHGKLYLFRSIYPNLKLFRVHSKPLQLVNLTLWASNWCLELAFRVQCLLSDPGGAVLLRS